ncbi:unnamed protein product [Dibothriocephalus latus]|uniref:Uncharacterized protein n=1 Tax=Dibothriocephalus latus TaxID=60516 RepID=A0A3P7N9J8_DIBLA|nr:unnamed protein product [Dibothriocephalus latus]
MSSVAHHRIPKCCPPGSSMEIRCPPLIVSPPVSPFCVCMCPLCRSSASFISLVQCRCSARPSGHRL